MSAIAQIRNWLSQFTGYPVGSSSYLTVNEYQPVIVVLRTPLNTTTTSNSDTYRVPNPYNLLVQRVRGMFGFRALTSETLTITGVGNPDIIERVMMHASNCRVELKNDDKDYDVIDNQQLVLAPILPELGGAPVEFDPPLNVLTGQTLKMTVSLNDTTTAVVGGNSEYGLVLEGVLVRTDGG